MSMTNRAGRTLALCWILVAVTGTAAAPNPSWAQEAALDAIPNAAEIHERTLTIDTHVDTPMRSGGKRL